MSQSMSSSLNLEELSEPIIVLGRGVTSHSDKYRCLAHCIAGLENNSRWIRLYPIRYRNEGSKPKKFDIIRIKVIDDNPEFRVESRKPDIAVAPVKIGVVTEKERITILKNNLDSGKFLHDNSWRGTKTLGLINPKYPEFVIDKNKILVRYKCDYSECNRHVTEVPHCTMEEYGLQDRIFEDRSGLEESLIELNRQILLHRKQLWFVMGTILTHPQKWILIEIHIT